VSVFKDFAQTKKTIDEIILYYPASVKRFTGLLSNELKGSYHSVMGGLKKLPLRSSGYLVFSAVNFSSYGLISVHCDRCKNGTKDPRRQFGYYKPSLKNVLNKIVPCPKCLNDDLDYFAVVYGHAWYFPVFKFLLKKHLLKAIARGVVKG
jgi:hypothetical protein